MRFLLLSIVVFSCLLGFSQTYSGTLSTGVQDMTITIQTNPSLDIADITMTGPANLWFTFGFGNTVMSGTYIMLAEGTGGPNEFQERKLGGRSQGSVLASSVTMLSNEVNGGIRTIKVRRNGLTGPTGDHFAFPTGEGSFSTIWAYANNEAVITRRHTRRGITSITLTEDVDCPPIADTTLLDPIFACANESALVFNDPQTEAGFYYNQLTTDAGCDSFLKVELVHYPIFDIQLDTIEICEGESAMIFGVEQTMEGNYATEDLSVNGCDSITRQFLKVHPTERTTLEPINLCEGTCAIIFNVERCASGTYFDTVQSQFNCDSILSQTLTISSKTFETLATIELCEGDSVLIFGNFEREENVYFDTTTGMNGCDSITSQSLIVYPKYFTNLGTIGICEGDSAFIFGRFISTAGVYMDSLQTVHGCDSVEQVTLTVGARFESQLEDAFICKGDSILIFNEFRKEVGEYVDSLKTTEGCDSIFRQQLFFFDNAFDTLDAITKCEGDSALVFGTYRYTAGTYIDTTKGSNGCDSFTYQTVNFVEFFETYLEDIEICEGDSAFIFGAFRFVADEYSKVFVTSANCDSAVYQTLMVTPFFETTLATIEICEGDSALIFGEQYKESGSYTDTLTSTADCDSFVTQELIVYPSYFTNLDSVVICEGDSVEIFGAFRKASGIFFDSLSTINGCDSIFRQALVVGSIDQTVLSILTICKGDSALIFDSFRTNAGTYRDTMTNQFGCDSIIVQVLRVDEGYVTELPLLSICEGDSALIFNTFYFDAGVYDDSLKSIEGCDSVLRQELMVLAPTTTEVDTSTCSNEPYFAGGGFQSQSGVYTDTLASITGCDSIIITNLAVKEAFSDTLENIRLCAGDSALIFGEWQSQAGTYVNMLTSIEGCDSLEYINLRLDSTSFRQDSVAICSGDSYFAGGMEQFKPGVYTDTFASVIGCDSIVETILSIIELDVEVGVNDSATIISAAAVGGATYQWIDCNTNTPIDSATNVTFEPTIKGAYAVIITKGDCIDTSACVEAGKVLNLAVTYNLKDLMMYPNPVHNMLTVQFGTSVDGAIITVYATTGQIVLRRSNINGTETRLNVAALPVGVYQLEVDHAGANTRKPFIKR